MNDKPLELQLPQFDPMKFDKAGFVRDLDAWKAQGLFDDIKTEDQLNALLAQLIAKNYGNGEHLYLLTSIHEAHAQLQKLTTELDLAIARKESVEEGRRQGVESAANLRGILGEIMGVKAQGDRIEKKVGETRRDQLTRAHYDRVNDIEPTTRSSGGGRKQKRDLDDKQVKAVVALSPATHPRPIMECCAEVIRKGGKYKNPYTDAKNLAAAVRRYGKRTKTKLTFKARSGRWSAKS